ncbi:MAG TPA: tetratricopeptide repeat protein [Thermoanaerobaculia bacterium]|nr:tetratricopeptide repeat protein [Thermoanaerobaculia bacterium]
MRRLLIPAIALLALTSCETFRSNGNPYQKPLFYERYLDSNRTLDQEIRSTIEALRADPDSPVLHNQLGMLLAGKGFPKDAEVEFERAINEDGRFYPAWYNLGLLRASRGDHFGARRAFGRTIRYKPGHAAALFQLGLLEEERKNSDRAIAYYAKALKINRALLDVHVNPRVLDSRLVHLALIEAYPDDHARTAIQFQPAGDYVAPKPPQDAPSPQPNAQEIVPPAAPLTDPARQTPAPTPAAPAPTPVPAPPPPGA